MGRRTDLSKKAIDWKKIKTETDNYLNSLDKDSLPELIHSKKRLNHTQIQKSLSCKNHIYSLIKKEEFDIRQIHDSYKERHSFLSKALNEIWENKQEMSMQSNRQRNKAIELKEQLEILEKKDGFYIHGKYILTEERCIKCGDVKKHQKIVYLNEINYLELRNMPLPLLEEKEVLKNVK